MANSDDKIIDVHMHVGLRGDQWPHLGQFSGWYRRQLIYKIFLLYARVDEDQVTDSYLREKTIEAIDTCGLDKVVCLALDPVYDANGNRCTGLSHVWVDNDYIVNDLMKALPDKILLGASVHPYDPNLKRLVNEYIDKGAVLLKWLPSAQQINLADDRVKEALTFLATACDGKPLPLLLHVGPEYAIPSSNSRTSSYDYLSWTWWDKLRNSFRGPKKWYSPRTKKINENLRTALMEGAIIIFAHCGLPYYAPNWLKRFLEHSDFKTVSRYLEKFPAGSAEKGCCYADLSACVTPFRRSYFPAIRKLPARSLLFGSDFPTPVFEISADVGEMMKDLKEVLKGNLDRIIIPQDNLLDVNLRELQHAFPGHPMFTNFNVFLRRD